MAGYWWLSVLPGLCIMLVVLAANLLGDWFPRLVRSAITTIIEDRTED